MRLVPTLALISGITLGAFVLGGCAENRTTIFIDHVLAQDGTADECDVNPTSEFRRSRGYYDPLGDGSYLASVSVASQMASLGNKNTLRAETSRIQIQGADVSVTRSEGGTEVTIISEFRQLLSGILDPSTSNTPSYHSIWVEMIPESMFDELEDGEYAVNIEIYGETLGNQKVRTSRFVFPVRVENGSHAACNTTYQELVDAAATDPCGTVGQDGYPYACDPDLSQSFRPTGCEPCP